MPEGTPLAHEERAPRVSVVVPCFNYEQHLPGTVASVLAQTYDDFEIVIVDDGSSDRSAHVAEELIAAHPGGRIRLIRQDNCGHPSITRNNGIAASQGEYVLCLDADDELEPRFLELCVAALDSNAAAGVAFTDQKDFGASDAHHRVAPYDFESLKHQNCFGICSLFRRAAWDAVGGWDPLIPFEDWDFWIACGAAGWHGIKVEGTAWRYRTSDSGRFQKLIDAGDAEVKAKMVLKRPQLYTEAQRAWAHGVLEGDPRWSATPHDFGYIPRAPVAVDGAAGSALSLDTRGFVALAFADELVSTPEMLHAWAKAFSASDDATLLVYAPEEEFGPLTAQLTEQLAALGLDGDPQAPDMLAVPVAAQHARAVRGRADVVYTRGSGNATLPRFDDRSLELLRSLIADRLEPKRAPRVLCWSPYNKWALHGQWEMTILHGLRMRGAEVHYLLCDALFSDCDIYWEATNPRRPGACEECQADVTRLVAELGMDYGWLGRYLNADDQSEARRWADALPAHELAHARYGDWEVGQWVTGSVHSHLRASRLDVADPGVERTYRSYVYSGLIACLALDRAITSLEPDVLFTFSGRVSSTRVACEIARSRGIRTIVHERGPRNETLTLAVDNSCVSLEPLRRFWREWGDVPLSAEELEDIHRTLFERAHGVNTGWRALTAAPQPLAEVCAQLGLDPERPLWVLFTSSDDEVVFEPDWQGGITSQVELIERTAAYAAGHPELQLVVRVHPNTGSRRSTGANRGQLEEMEALRERLGHAVTMVMPEDDVSSYTLIDLCNVGVVSHSTIGLELACRGKAVVAASGGVVTGTPFVHTLDEPERYEELLDGLLALPAGHTDMEVRRLAYRMAYGVFFRTVVPFPLLRMEESHIGVPQWASPQDLVPGRDAALDRCSRILLDGEPVCPPPGPAELARRDAQETAFFEAADATPRFTALAFADELIEDPSLLEAWAATFSEADPATLVVHTPIDATEGLVRAVAEAGLDGSGTPDLVAVDAAREGLGSVDAVFSRREQEDLLAAAPRFDDGSVASLRHFADACQGR